jgi:hypothetical protein
VTGRAVQERYYIAVFDVETKVCGCEPAHDYVHQCPDPKTVIVTRTYKAKLTGSQMSVYDTPGKARSAAKRSGSSAARVLTFTFDDLEVLGQDADAEYTVAERKMLAQAERADAAKKRMTKE